MAYNQVWESGGSNFVRVMHEGTPKPTLEWVPLDSFIDLINSQIPADIFGECHST